MYIDFKAFQKAVLVGLAFNLILIAFYLITHPPQQTTQVPLGAFTSRYLIFPFLIGIAYWYFGDRRRSSQELIIGGSLSAIFSALVLGALIVMLDFILPFTNNVINLMNYFTYRITDLSYGALLGAIGGFSAPILGKILP